MKKSLIFSIFLAVFLALINYSISMMAGLYIASSLGGSRYISIYTIVFYSLGNALGVPLGRYLADRLGLSRSFFLCLFTMAIFSLFCATSTNFLTFIAFRFLKGVAAGPLFTLGALALPKKSYVPPINITMFVMAPILGACLGGWIAYDYNWRWLFYGNMPICLMLGIYIRITLKAPEPLKILNFDWTGYIFYFVSIFCLGFTLTTGQQFDWFRSPLITTTFTLGVVCLPFFILWSLLHSRPFLNFRLFYHPVFLFAITNLTLLFSSYFGMVILLALWLALDASFTPLWIGVILGSMILVAYLPAILIHERMLIDSRITLVAGLICLIWSCFRTQTFNVEINFERIAFSRFLAGTGIAFFVPSVFRLCYHTFQVKRTIEVLEIFQVARGLASGLGAAFYTTLWERRLTFYHDRLGSNLTVYSPKTQQFFSLAKQIGIEGGMANEQLEVYLQRISDSLALDDCFYMMGWLLAGLLILCLLTLFFPKHHFFPEKKVPATIDLKPTAS